MKKTVTVNGQKVKVTFEELGSEWTKLPNTETEFNCGKKNLSFMINDVKYENVFVKYCKQNKKSGILYFDYYCTKTNTKFTDSYIKLIEHLLN